MMQVVEITGSQIPEFPPEELHGSEEAYFPGKLTTEEGHHQARYRHARQMGAHRPDFLELGLAERQILLVIFEMRLDFPPSLVAFVNPHGVVEGFVADEHVADNFFLLVLRHTPAHHEDDLAVNMVMRPDALIAVIFFEVLPLAFRHLFHDFRRCQQFPPEFELVLAIRLAHYTESRVVRGVHDLLNVVGAVEDEFDLSEVASPSVALLFQAENLIPCDIVFRAVVGMLRGQPHDEGEGDHRVAGDRQHEDVIVAHDVAVLGTVKELVYELHVLAGLLGLGVVENDPDPFSALRRGVGEAEIGEEIEKQRHGQHAEQFFKRLRMLRQDSVKLSQIPAVFFAELAERILLQKGEKDEDPYPLVQMRRFVVGKTGFYDKKSQASAGQPSDQAGTLCFFRSPAHFSVSLFLFFIVVVYLLYIIHRE